MAKDYMKVNEVVRSINLVCENLERPIKKIEIDRMRRRVEGNRNILKDDYYIELKNDTFYIDYIYEYDDIFGEDKIERLATIDKTGKIRRKSKYFMNMNTINILNGKYKELTYAEMTAYLSWFTKHNMGSLLLKELNTRTYGRYCCYMINEREILIRIPFITRSSKVEYTDVYIRNYNTRISSNKKEGYDTTIIKTLGGYTEEKGKLNVIRSFLITYIDGDDRIMIETRNNREYISDKKESRTLKKLS